MQHFFFSLYLAGVQRPRRYDIITFLIIPGIIVIILISSRAAQPGYK